MTNSPAAGLAPGVELRGSNATTRDSVVAGRGDSRLPHIRSAGPE